MTRKQYLRRIAILCLYCLRNMAFYRAGWNRGSLINNQSQFWVTLNGNFLDICVLEWCKLFGDSRGKHFWGKGVSDPKKFNDGLLQSLSMTNEGFKRYVVEMRTYRDRYVAHLDLDEKFDIPNLDIAKESVLYLYDYLLNQEDDGGYFVDGPPKAASFYKEAIKEGQVVYRNENTK